MNKNLYVVLMAGGVGTRFWPYSRNSQPQFLDVLGTGKTLLQSSYERFLPLCPKENIYIVTSDEHAEITHETASDLTVIRFSRSQCEKIQHLVLPMLLTKFQN